MFPRCIELRAVSMRIGLVASALLAQGWVSVEAAGEKFQSYQQFASSSVPQDILWKVLARSGRSKTYTQVLPLDGGTVGIANFAVGGLASLYRHMNTEKYFRRTRDDMIRNYSNGCRPAGTEEMTPAGDAILANGGVAG